MPEKCSEKAITDFVSMKEYVDMRFDMLDKQVTMSLAASDRAVQKAEFASDKRFESVNEFRATLSDNSRLFMPRLEYEQAHRNLEDRITTIASASDTRINGLMDRLNRREAEWHGLNRGWMYLVGVMGFIATVCSIIYFIMQGIHRSGS